MGARIGTRSQLGSMLEWDYQRTLVFTAPAPLGRSASWRRLLAQWRTCRVMVTARLSSCSQVPGETLYSLILTQKSPLGVGLFSEHSHRCSEHMSIRRPTVP